MMRTLFLSFLLIAAGCSPTSLEDFQHEGEAHCRVLILELQKITTYEELLHAESRLKQHFEKLVDLMIQARQWQLKYPQEQALVDMEKETSLQLQEELRRIYAFEGGRQRIEKVQQEALVRLDAFERSRKGRSS